MKYGLQAHVAVFAVAVLCSFSASAQDGEANAETDAVTYEANPADVASIDAITTAVYDVISGEAGEKRDWDRFRSLFRPEAQLIPLVRRNGETGLLAMSPEEYKERSGAWLEENGFFEVEINRKTEQYGLIAHHFSTYESRRSADDAEPFARGINSFQLMNDGTRWWIVNIFWQAEGPNFPIPADYLP